MVYGIDGKFGGCGNVLSTTCRPREPFRGSNPTLTAKIESDVETFHIERLLKSGECHVRTTKTGRKVKVYTWGS
jgi:hypothetical protein